MKENRKLLKEVLKDIRHDMTDEEVLNLLADSKISVSPESGKRKVYAWTACGGCYCEIRGELGVYFFLYRSSDPLDGGQHGAGCQSV